MTSTSTMITIATEKPLPPEALHKITIANDPTQLLERLREALDETAFYIPSVKEMSDDVARHRDIIGKYT